jgi:hypothetical protein
MEPVELADDMPGWDEYKSYCENKSKLIGELVSIGSF